jgi:2-oxoglutarate dehydrogenase E1 component
VEKQAFMNRSNVDYVESLYQDFLKNRPAVPPEWQNFFEGYEFALAVGSKTTSVSAKELDVYKLAVAYRDYGHLKARLDPLEMTAPDEGFFNLKRFSLSEADLDKKHSISAAFGKPGATLRELIGHLERCYCGTLTAQVAECDAAVRDWFHREMESTNAEGLFDVEKKKLIYQHLARTESLEKFIHTRFVGVKRFSIEGGDALIPMLEHLVEAGGALGLKEIVIGMAHRGRVNVLANFMGKALEQVLAEFDGRSPEIEDFEGDVKYHLGYSSTKETAAGPVAISLAFNPSHLEAVNPVVLGKTRAKQRVHKDTSERRKVTAVLIHGDAAFIGQGVVAETFQLSQLEGYRTGGTIHVVINNQVGFTTNPGDGRSTRYSSDVAKTIKAPVLLVNGDDAEACVRAMDMAVRFRQQFRQDVVIDLICYRRFGHNEGDEPAFTQPLMYEKIQRHPTPRAIYAQKIVQQGVDQRFIDDFLQEKMTNLQATLDGVRKHPPTIQPESMGHLWSGLKRGTRADMEAVFDTTADMKDLGAVAQLLSSEPPQFNLHPKMKKLIEARREMVQKDQLDWAVCELLAYGTLCREGTPVRLSGQDCMRGTFTHRQCVYFDTQTGARYSPLATIDPERGEFCVYNSPLSEMAVLGFEYGNSTSDPTYLTIWEAQFGDFANGAQIIIDQFLSSGEIKWLRMCGLTLLLPHGYEGQGPEHSSARLERFLQLCAQDNMQVHNLTTPANLFHALRRQVSRNFRKPLIIMSPKSLLRHPKVVSSMKDLSHGQFMSVLPDPNVKDPARIDRLVFCSGKIYYDLLAAREAAGFKDRLAVVRIEEIFPFPRTKVASFLAGFPKIRDVVWCQEEPKNNGAWTFVAPHLEDIVEELGLRNLPVRYAGRPEKASPATGSPKRHQAEQSEIIKQVLSEPLV